MLCLERDAFRSRQVVRSELIDRAGSSGWMADFGEALPCEGIRLHSGGDACAAHNISVFASFELLSAEHRLDTEIGFTLVNADLIKKLTILNHPAVVLWFVGNELNLPSTGWACNVTRAEKLEGDACQFGGAEPYREMPRRS